ncbi:MAG: SCO family protein [Acidobacteriota bacterium]|nr:SCO family protein [Acidobacteriota bacterium]
MIRFPGTPSKLSLLAVAGILLAALSVQIPAQAAPDARVDSKARGAADYFTDVELVDQHGESHRLYSDLMQGKVVVINAMFTSCASSCPAMAARLSKMQRFLGDRLGDDVHILSISVDPERDTPERLLTFADSFGAKPGWYLLSGKPDNVNLALTKLGQYVDEPETHKSIMIMGNESTGLWKKAMGLAPAEELIAVLESVLEDRE